MLSSSSISKSIIDINSQSKKERAKSERNQSSSRNLATISKSKLENKFSESPLQSNFETKSKHDTSSPYSKRNTQTIQSPSVRDYKIEKLESAMSVTNNQVFIFYFKINVFIKKKEIKPSSKPRNILIIIKNISVAINKLRNRTKFKPIKYLESEQIELIGDKAFFPQQNENLNKEMIKMLLSKNIFSIYFYKIKIFIKKVRVLKNIGKLFSKFYIK